MPTLVLVRHGESDWNKQNRFTGWIDVDLSETGIAQARRSGELLKAQGIVFDRAFTSVLRRAVRTLWLMMDEADQMWLPVATDWRLNERHYGALQGLNKAETAARHGDEQVHIWRRSFDIPPPPLDEAEIDRLAADPRYRGVPRAQLPVRESLKMTLERVMPAWRDSLAPALRLGQSLLVSAHGNSLRALVKHLLEISDETIPTLEIPTGNPLLFELGDDLAVRACRYLDEERKGPLPTSPG
jgi:2,3-bisphosphoglycerate-dependent phosphoglycerate mutase